MSDVVWKHFYNFTHAKGRVRVTCKPCGISSKWFDAIAENEEMIAWCNEHTLKRTRKAA